MKVGTTLYPSGRFETMTDLKLKPLMGLDWFANIDSSKYITPFMAKFTEVYMRNLNTVQFKPVQDDHSPLAHKATDKRRRSASLAKEDHADHEKRLEPLLTVLDPHPTLSRSKVPFMFSSIEPDKQSPTVEPKIYEPTQTGALFMRIDANRMRSENLVLTGDPLARKMTKFDAPHVAKAPKSSATDGLKRDNLNFNFLREHDLDEYYRLADPQHRELPATQQSQHDILKTIHAPDVEEETQS